MNLQDEFAAAGEEFARQLAERTEARRLAALEREAQYDGNAQAFAAAVEAQFSDLDAHLSDASTDTQE